MFQIKLLLSILFIVSQTTPVFSQCIHGEYEVSSGSYFKDFAYSAGKIEQIAISAVDPTLMFLAAGKQVHFVQFSQQDGGFVVLRTWSSSDCSNSK